MLSNVSRDFTNRKHRAYEITTHWKKTPPPREILEDTTARGGDLLNRTVENYQPRISREQENLANGDKSDSEELEDELGGLDGESLETKSII